MRLNAIRYGFLSICALPVVIGGGCASVASADEMTLRRTLDTLCDGEVRAVVAPRERGVEGGPTQGGVDVYVDEDAFRQVWTFVEYRAGGDVGRISSTVVFSNGWLGDIPSLGETTWRVEPTRDGTVARNIATGERYELADDSGCVVLVRSP